MSESFLLLDGYEALGTKWYLEVFEELSEEKKELIRSEIATLLTSFGARYSRFNPDSLLNELNSKRTISYDEHLAKMLTLGEEAYRKSEEVFNLFVKDALEKKGYGGVEMKEEVPQPRHAHSGDGRVSVSPESISLICDGAVDLGGIGKEYLIDYIASLLKNSYHVGQFLINGGGDMYATHQSGDAIEVYMEHPENHGEMIGSLLLKNQAFCCSSSFVRMWQDGDATRNHFVSKDGDEVWAASFVVAESATYAGIVATVACIASSDQVACKKVAREYSSQYAVYLEGSLFGDIVYTPAA